VSVQAHEPDECLAPETSIALFRIVQEALNNVTKHARAKNVAITLSRANRELVLTIADDGVGFACAAQSPDRPRPGLGLVTMRERAQALGGCFTIEPLAEGAGTRVTVKVPA
jgi:signal transduction histidine kinase